MWRYEISWAPQAYYARFPGRPWQRGNQWFKMKSPSRLCAVGMHCGRYRHSMVASHDYDFLYVFGGQGIGRWYDSLYRYRTMTDMWEDMEPQGILKSELTTQNNHFCSKVSIIALNISLRSWFDIALNILQRDRLFVFSFFNFCCNVSLRIVRFAYNYRLQVDPQTLSWEWFDINLDELDDSTP